MNINYNFMLLLLSRENGEHTISHNYYLNIDFWIKMKNKWFACMAKCAVCLINSKFYWYSKKKITEAWFWQLYYDTDNAANLKLTLPCSIALVYIIVYIQTYGKIRTHTHTYKHRGISQRFATLHIFALCFFFRSRCWKRLRWCDGACFSIRIIYKTINSDWFWYLHRLFYPHVCIICYLPLILLLLFCSLSLSRLSD